ncbi:MAG TPA: polyprenyl diphosphate synthase [Clostridia bacterium]|jgi:undecaprenyl diphosphate synthase|nr:polyprenyl diphosphate synthase [Clostridia bacterium]
MKHLAIIMDGNGRWAQAQGLPRLSGHKAAVNVITEIIDAADELEVKVLSLYAFSLDNFKRDVSEVYGILGIINDYIESELIPLVRTRGYKLMFIGELNRLPQELLTTISKAYQIGVNNKGMQIVIAIAYSGREEIVKAFNLLLEEKINNGDYTPINRKELSNRLYTTTIPDPDAIVRYGGHKRLSDFLTYQSVYSELFFLEKNFPDATREDIFIIKEKFLKIKRNFGEIKQ